MAQVRHRVATGLVDPAEDFDEEHQHLDALGALRELERQQPADEDLVVCHGDYRPPNALLTAGRVTGHVDLGELGVADRWWDLGVATRAVTWNYGTGFEALFLAVYDTHRPATPGVLPAPLRPRLLTPGGA
jgi:kanamycin kinase